MREHAFFGLGEVKRDHTTLKSKKKGQNKMQTNVKLILMSAMVSAGFQAQGSNLVLNGNFATGDLTDWSSGGGNFVQSSFEYSPPAGDEYFLAFGSVGSDSLLSQTIPTTTGGTYDFSFLVAGNGSGDSDLNAYWNGALIYTLGSPIPEQGYTEYSFTETAAGSSTAISFGLRNDPSYDALDNICVTPTSGAHVPEGGSSLAMATPALLGLFGFSRKFGRQSAA
jgi:hypothetical protein